MLALADSVLGQTAAEARRVAGDHWVDVWPGHEARLEVAYPFAGALGVNEQMPPSDREDLGVRLRLARGQIAEVSLQLAPSDAETVPAALTAQWGRPRTKQDATWTWQTPDRTIIAALRGDGYRITLRTREARRPRRSARRAG